MIFPSFEFVFLFDQSSGHTKKRNDGLVASRLNVSYGGGSPTMHDTVVEDFGMFPSILSLGDTQQLSFQESDIGAFWMDAEARLNSKFDTNIGGTSCRDRTKAELLRDLRIKGFDTTKKRFLKSELEDLYIINDIPIRVDILNIEYCWY